MLRVNNKIWPQLISTCKPQSTFFSKEILKRHWSMLLIKVGIWKIQISLSCWPTELEDIIFLRNNNWKPYCWWFRNPVNSPVEIGRLSPLFTTGFKNIPRDPSTVFLRSYTSHCHPPGFTVRAVGLSQSNSSLFKEVPWYFCWKPQGWCHQN